jgi:16S rRNA (cytosine967-C5)-methyltransferase
MPISPARVAAFQILLRVEQEDAYASELLHSSRYAKLTAPDHGLATELVMGVLRWRSWLDREIVRQSSLPLTKLDSEVLTSLRLGAYQLMFLDRIPARAAIHESVELVKQARKRSAVSFANAVLRKLAGLGTQTQTAFAIESSTTPSQLAALSAHPEWLVERWVREFGFDRAVEICSYDQQIPETEIRIGDPADEEELKKENIRLAPGRLLSSARRVIAGSLTATQAFRRGRIAIQDEASQLVALLVGTGSSILDCCAAPGGKTRAMAEYNPSATVVATELHPHRARLLRKLVSAPNVQVVAADARALPLGMLFDRVLVDVPCSGTGTLAHNPEIKWRLRAEDLADLHTRQLAILRSAMERVAPRGRLVYATCSLEREENQVVVEAALSSDGSFQLLSCQERLQQLRSQRELVWDDPSSLTSGPHLRTIPGVHPCDGFFAAILEKTGS